MPKTNAVHMKNAVLSRISGPSDAFACVSGQRVNIPLDKTTTLNFTKEHLLSMLSLLEEDVPNETPAKVVDSKQIVNIMCGGMDATINFIHADGFLALDEAHIVQSSETLMSVLSRTISYKTYARLASRMTESLER